MTKGAREMIAEALSYHRQWGNPKLDETLPALIESALRNANYVIVPKEPSEGMLMAAHRKTAGWLNLPGPTSALSQALEKHRLRYKAMLLQAEKENS